MWDRTGWSATAQQESRGASSGEGSRAHGSSSPLALSRLKCNCEAVEGLLDRGTLILACKGHGDRESETSIADGGSRS